MKSILAYANALREPLSLRILSLLMQHSLSAESLAAALKQPLEEITSSLKGIAAAQLVKTSEKSGNYKLKSSAKTELKALFAKHKLSVEKDATLKRDLKLSKLVRAALKQASQVAKKAKAEALAQS
jgi:DNA-binding transcriptional ArsR family regulator